MSAVAAVVELPPVFFCFLYFFFLIIIIIIIYYLKNMTSRLRGKFKLKITRASKFVGIAAFRRRFFFCSVCGCQVGKYTAVSWFVPFRILFFYFNFSVVSFFLPGIMTA
jgi:hypothetical protein